MNIFVLHEIPSRAASMLCNAHIVKMITEQAQMLCYAHLTANPKKRWVARNIKFSLNKGHSRHPCTLWLIEDPRHYAWGYNLLLAMLKEYDYRYAGLQKGKYAKIIGMLPALSNVPGTDLKTDQVIGLPDEFVLAMGKAPECIGPDAVEAYRRFYLVDKHTFAVWKRRKPPEWFGRGLRQYKEHGDISRVTVN